MSITAPGALILLSTLLLSAPITATVADTPSADTASPARITVSGSGEAVAPAARANLTLGIQTQGATAALAGADGARLAQAVSNALRGAGLPSADLKATHLVINPQWIYDDHTRQRRRTGFQADTTLIISTTLLDRLGAWVDAALGAGATNVSDPTFMAADDASLRHTALSRAVQNAHGDAEVIASAAGGSLGALLQLTSAQEFARPGPVMRTLAVASAAAPAPPTSITPGDIHVTATVSGVWRYIAGPGASGR